jgi:hypothetical protein
LERTHESFEILVGDGTDVASFGDLVLHDPIKFFFEFDHRISIGRGLCGGNDGKTNDETVTKTRNNVCILFVDTRFLEKGKPNLWMIRSERLRSSVIEGIPELRAKFECNQSRGVWYRACCWGTLCFAAIRGRWEHWCREGVALL